MSRAPSLVEILVRLKVLNNYLPIDEKERVRWENAMWELDKFDGRRRDMPYPGFLLLTHGYLFECTSNGWMIRPRKYIADFAQSLPAEERRAFYERRRREKYNFSTY